MSATDLLTAIRSEIVDADLGRLPGTTGSEHPVFLQPGGGAPAPGDLEGVEADSTLVLSLFYSGGIPPEVEGGAARPRRLTVDFWIRVAHAQLAFDLDEDLDALFVGLDKRNYDLGSGGSARRIVSSEKWRELAPLESTPRADSAGGGYVFTFLSAYLFELYRDA